MRERAIVPGYLIQYLTAQSKGTVLVPDQKLDLSDALQLRQKALSRWDNEGGAGPQGPQTSSMLSGAQADVPPLTNTELVQLRVRVIALVREMASYISPRPGFTHHPLTTHAAVHMNNLVDRARHFQNRASSEHSTRDCPPQGTVGLNQNTPPQRRP
jgi:hypothetical protein